MSTASRSGGVARGPSSETSLRADFVVVAVRLFRKEVAAKERYPPLGK